MCPWDWLTRCPASACAHPPRKKEGLATSFAWVDLDAMEGVCWPPPDLSAPPIWLIRLGNAWSASSRPCHRQRSYVAPTRGNRRIVWVDLSIGRRLALFLWHWPPAALMAAITSLRHRLFRDDRMQGDTGWLLFARQMSSPRCLGSGRIVRCRAAETTEDAFWPIVAVGSSAETWDGRESTCQAMAPPVNCG